MKKNLTIQDIAEAAGVAKSTVSRYLNNGAVKESTKKRIKEIIEEVNYEPNAFARLKAKKSNIIGVVAPCLDSTVTSMVLMSLDETLKKAGYTSLILNTNHDIEEELKDIERLGKMNVDGIIVNATKICDRHFQIANQLDIPVVFLAQHFENQISIINEDYLAGYKAGEVAGNLNNKDVLCVSVDPDDVAIGVERLNGILAGCKDFGVDHVEVVRSDFGNIKSYRVIDEVLSKKKPDLILCSTTRQLLAAYKCIRDHGYKIPDDISVIAFGGYDVVDLLEPLPTTIQFNPKELGQVAATTILDVIDDKEVVQLQCIPFVFLEGASVKRRES